MSNPMTDVAEIALTQGQVAIVDAADFEWLSQWKWHAVRNGGTFYAVRGGGRYPKLIMHRVIMGEPVGLVVDHINHNGLDNRRANLRECTHAENLRNRRGAQRGSASQYLGVSWHKETVKWYAHISINGKHTHLGYFKDERLAALERDAASRLHFGEFANLNFGDAT